MNPSALTGAILAGGRGSRMGGLTKPLLLRPDGRTLLSAIDEALADGVASILVVATEATRHALARTTPRPLVIDPGRGPAAALLAVAQSEATREWILLVGGDHVRPSPAPVDLLAAHARDDGADAVAFVHCGRRQPLWALYRRQAVIDLARQAPLDGVSLLRVLDRLRTTDLDADAQPDEVGAAFIGVNTWDDARKHGVRRP